MTFLKADCPVGCPCPTYDCDEVTTSAPITTAPPVQIDHVLVLNTRNSNNKPTVIQSAGGSKLATNFQYGDGTDAYHSCGLIFKGEAYMFGGINKQISKEIARKIVLPLQTLHQ